MNPVNDTFLTSSADRTVRLWDLQNAASISVMEMPKSGKGIAMDPTGFPLAAFDCTGLVFGIAAPLDANAGYVSQQFILDQGSIRKVFMIVIAIHFLIQ